MSINEIEDEQDQGRFKTYVIEENKKYLIQNPSATSFKCDKSGKHIIRNLDKLIIHKLNEDFIIRTIKFLTILIIFLHATQKSFFDTIDAWEENWLIMTILLGLVDGLIQLNLVELYIIKYLIRKRIWWQPILYLLRGQTISVTIYISQIQKMKNLLKDEVLC